MNINSNVAAAYQVQTQQATNKAQQPKTAQDKEPNSTKVQDAVKIDIEKKSKALKIQALEIVKNYKADRKEAITNLSKSLQIFEK